MAFSHAEIWASLHRRYLKIRRTFGSGGLIVITQEIILVMAITSFVPRCG
jgi:hypothetical protein